MPAHVSVTPPFSASIPYRQQLQAVLAYLQAQSPESEAVLYCCSSGEQIERLTAGGQEHTQTLPAPAAKAWHTGCYSSSSHFQAYPLQYQQQVLGVLQLRLPGPAKDHLRHCIRWLRQILLFYQESGLSPQHLKALHSLIKVLGQCDSLQTVIAQALPAIRQISSARGVLFRPLEPEFILSSRPYAYFQPSEAPMEQTCRILEQDLHTYVWNSGRPCLRHLHNRLLLLGLPLRSREHNLGTLFLLLPANSQGILLPAQQRSFLRCLKQYLATTLLRLLQLEQLEALTRQKTQQLHESRLLFHLSRMLHSTIQLNELTHLILSLAASPKGADLGEAMLFLCNPKAKSIQGMLGITPESAAYVLPGSIHELQQLQLSPEARQKQHEDAFCRQVVKIRLALDAADNPLAQTLLQTREATPIKEPTDPKKRSIIGQQLNLTEYVCIPLYGRQNPLGLMVLTFPWEQEPHKGPLLEMFSNMVALAMDNSLLHSHLEKSHDQLRSTQERLLQEEKMAVFGQMAASLVHELKNPLVAIGGFARRLNQKQPPRKQQEYAGIILRETQRMERLLQETLEYARPQRLQLRSCQATDLIDDVLELEEETLQQQQIELEMDIAEYLQPIAADADKLRQVLLNLVANARQAMPNGGVLTLRAYNSTLRQENAVALEIEDTGDGIPQSIIRNIFNPFYTTKKKGTGLGLSVAYSIIEQHQGEFQVRNTAQGACFTLILPVQQSDP